MVRSYAVNRSAVISALFLALAAALFATGPRPWAAGTAHAQAGESAPTDEPLKGRLVKIDIPGKSIKLEPGGVLAISAAHMMKIEGDVKNGIVREGRWVHVMVDPQYRVLSIKEELAPTGASTPENTTDQQKAIVATANTLVKGDRVELDGQEVFFEKLLQNQVYYSVQLGGLLVPKSIKRIRSLKKVEGGAIPHETTERKLKRGFYYRINEEFTGACWGGAWNEFIDLALYPSEERRIFPWSQIVKIEEVPNPAFSTSAGSTAGAGVAALDPDEIPVKLAELVEQSQLDWTANEWRIPATFRQRLEDKIIIGARVEATFKGGGYYVTPEKEPDLIRELGPGYKQIEEFRDLQGIRHHIRRDAESGNLWLFAELNGAAISQISQPIAAALFPGADATVELRVPLYFPVLADGPRLRYDKEKGVLPFSDERALPYLVNAYSEDTTAEVKEKILDAFARSGNAKILPFLLFQVYIDGTPKGVPKVRLAIKKMGAVSEEYLIGLIREEGYKKELIVPAPGGGVEKKQPKIPEDMLTRIIELLEDMHSERAVKDVLALVRDKNGGVRDAARSFFTSRGTAYMGSIVKRLQGKSLPDAKEVLLEMVRREPGSIGIYMREELKIDDPRLDASLQGLTADEIADRQVAYLIEKVKDMPLGDLDEEIERAREVVRRLGLEKAQVDALRREVSVEYAKQAVGLGSSHTDKDARPRIVQLLRRAIVLDPQNKSARRELAAIYLDISAELRAGGKLRAAPSDASRVVRPLVLGEGLSPVSVPEEEIHPADWRKARGQDGAEGWVHASLVQLGKTTIGVNQERRPVEHALGYVRLARTIAPDRNAEIEKAFADVTVLVGDEAAARGDWEAATGHYRTAASISPLHRAALTNAYLRSQPLIPGSIALAIAVLVGAAVIRPKDARTLTPLSGAKRGAAKEPAVTRKVPS